MKKNLFITVVLLSMAITTIAQVGIGTNDPSDSAILELKSTNRGLLFPRMTNIEMRSINNPEKGLAVYCSTCIGGSIMIFDGNIWQYLSKSIYNDDIIIDSYGNEYGTVQGHSVDDLGNKRTWLDRNLGATQVAQSENDHQAYGSLFQFGRYSDGHEIVTWTGSMTGEVTETETNQSSTHYPGHKKFIITHNNWNSSSETLWGPQSGILTNNPCPSGYRVPDADEWILEKSYWSQHDLTPFESNLNLPKAGKRDHETGNYNSGDYWYWSSSTHDGEGFSLNGHIISFSFFAVGMPIRCINEN